MNLLMGLFLAALAAGWTTGEEPPQMSAKAQAELDAALSGRTAREPLTCVSQRDLLGNRTVGGGAILFQGRGPLVYLNSPRGGCPRLDSGRTLRTITTSTRLCRGDIVTVIDNTSGINYGSCSLDDFVPYRRTE
ncbi:MAG: hypothetical protein ACXWUP_07025 [Allosphingosinicella sp.]